MKVAVEFKIDIEVQTNAVTGETRLVLTAGNWPKECDPKSANVLRDELNKAIERFIAKVKGVGYGVAKGENGVETVVNYDGKGGKQSITV